MCDIGFTGFDCSQRECDAGDDLRTSGQKNEVAYLYCRCPTNGGCGAIEVRVLIYSFFLLVICECFFSCHFLTLSTFYMQALSSFRLSFMGQKTKELSYNATNTTIAASLRELDAIRGSVRYLKRKLSNHV